MTNKYILIILFPLFLQSINDKINPVIKEPAKIERAGDSLTKKNLALFLVELKITDPELVFKQSMLETGNLTSKLAKQHNNLFGMKKPGKWTSKAEKTTKYRYLSYSNWKHSVEDYKEYQNRFVKGNYEEHLKNSRYSQTKGYCSLIKKIEVEEEIKQILNPKK